MIQTHLLSLGVFGVILIILFSTSTALDCYVCKDCESNFTSSNVVTCIKSTARCVKIINENQVIDRTCGEVSKCRGRDEYIFPNTTPRPRRSAPEHDDEKNRIRRQLLQEPKNKEQGFSEAVAIYCCKENECNGSYQLASSTTTYLISLYSCLLYYHYN